MSQAATSQQEWFGHPRGLFTLFMTEMWERFSYYGMRALLILFLTASVVDGGFGMDAPTAGAIYGLFTGGVYLFTLAGGWVADRLIGQQNAVLYGGILIAAGNFLLAIPSEMMFYLGLIVIILGTGLLKPNVSTIVGELYGSGTQQAKQDAGFSIFYMGINLGAFIAPLVTGTIGEGYGFRLGFLAAGVAMSLGLIQYQMTRGHLMGAGAEPAPSSPEAQAKGWKMLWVGLAISAALVVAALAGVLPVDIQVLAGAAGIFIVLLALAFFAYVLLFGGLTIGEKKRTLVIMVFFVAAALFWSGFEQAATTFNLFARDYTDRTLLGGLFESGMHPASWYQSINPLFIIVLSPVFAWIWVSLGRRNMDPSSPMKFSLGLFQLGLGFIVLMFASKLAVDQQVAPSWLLITYLLHTTGELCLSPIGLSNVTSLAPKRYVGQMMGTWFMGAALGNLFAGLIGGHVGGADIAEMPGQLLNMAWIGIGGGALLMVFAGVLKGWIGTHDDDSPEKLMEQPVEP
jgi:proton-dependent oligopeptide transporter, POT family